MNSLDVLIVVLLVLTTCFALRPPARVAGILLSCVSLLGLLMLVQFLWKGFYWQYVPAYVLFCLLLGTALLSSAPSRKLQRFSLSVLLLVALIPWATFLPVPTLATPAGRYAVGTHVFRWVDSTRAEEITNDPSDKRNVIVQAWYPAQEAAKGSHSLYLDGLPQLPPQVGPLPSFLLKHYDHIDTHAVADAPPLAAPRKWPVVLFLPGYGAARAFYTSLAVGLASHGYVVLCLDHPYEAAMTQLADGTLATTIEHFQPGAPNRLGFMKNRLDIRVADVQFILDQLAKQQASASPLFRLLDLTRIGITGHSLGGAAGAVAMARDARINAAVNLDGTLYGGLPKSAGHRPFLVVESNKGEPGHYARYEAGNQALFQHFGGGTRYELVGADHYSFTDVPLLLAPPARLLAGHLLKLGQLPAQTHAATISLLDAFFAQALSGQPPQLEAVAQRYPGTVRKPVGD